MKANPLTLSKLTFMLLSTLLLQACATAPSSDALTSTNRTSSAYVKGVPGGAFTEVETINATVSAIDYKTRSVTLKDAQGNQRTVIANPDVSNLEQVNVGDRVTIVAVIETVSYLRDHGQNAQDGTADMLLSNTNKNVAAMRTAKQRVSAVVSAVDIAKHQVTLHYSDNSSKTLPVREDVALSPSDVGREVVINISTAMAITVDPR